MNPRNDTKTHEQTTAKKTYARDGPVNHPVQPRYFFIAPAMSTYKISTQLAAVENFNFCPY